MKTLYVSDLDGTLLQSNEKTSEYTNTVINNLTAKGMLFSYATARSLITAKKAAKGINAKIPLIVYNGSFIMDNVTGEILKANYFDNSSAEELLNTLFKNGIYPIVYAYIDGKEKFSYIPELSTPGMKKFTDSRKGDIRENIVNTPEELRAGDIFYITCIGDPKLLGPIYEKYKDAFHCVYQVDIYTDEQWLEIMPKEASKANAILQLKSMLQCDRVIAFGDGKNDIDMFEIADEGYAVSNAHEDLKKIATAVILSNNEDGVAKWLEKLKKSSMLKIEDIIDIAREAGKIMLTAERPKIMEKSGHANFCTETDEKIQAFLIGKLSLIMPEASFLGEEDGQDVFTAKMSSGYCFVIDPIDGTSNFIYGYRPSVVSIALLRDGKPYMAVIYNPYDEMMFSAVSENGAYLNEEQIMSSEAPLSDSLTVFGTAPYYTELQERTFDLAKKLLPLCVDLRRSGTAAWDMCCVAMGRCSLYFEMKIQLWDYAAAALIAKEAGCMITDIDGNPLSFKGATSVICRARGIKEIPDCFL